MTDTHPQPSVLLLIPAYNEEERIGPVLCDYAKYFRENYGASVLFELCCVLFAR